MNTINHIIKQKFNHYKYNNMNFQHLKISKIIYNQCQMQAQLIWSQKEVKHLLNFQKLQAMKILNKINYSIQLISHRQKL